MDKIRVLVCDDEPIAIEVIKELILSLAPDLHIAGTATNGLEALEKISSIKPDLLFLDVDMPYLNGLNVLKLSSQTVATIFTAGHALHHFAERNKAVLGFLLKPIDPADFIDMIEKARVFLAGRSSAL